MKRLTPEEEQLILEECLDRGNCDELVRQYFYLVQYTVRKTLILKNIPFTLEDIEDLRNHVFVQIMEKDWRKLRQYQPEPGRSLSKWIILITNRIVLNRLREKGFGSFSGRNYQMAIEDVFSLEQPQNDSPIKEEQSHIIQRNIEKLPQERDRLILKMRYYHGLPMEEIASNLHITVNTANTAISRARSRLKQLVKDEMSEMGRERRERREKNGE